jgi:hypothetical protein
MTFDEQVATLRGKVVPKSTNKKKGDCTPEEWAALLDCRKAQYKDSPEKTKARSREWKKANPEKRRENNRAWRDANPEKARASNRAWRKANPNKQRTMQRAWRKANPEKHKTSRNRWQQKRYDNDPAYRMMVGLRNRQYEFFTGKARSLSMVRDMGCNREFFLRHIASQFTAGMTMENYGTVWHLDHIYPLAKADIVGNPVHFLAAANWRNLQPMLGPDNWEKSDEVTPEAQALFDALCQEFLAHAK